MKRVENFCPFPYKYIVMFNLLKSVFGTANTINYKSLLDQGAIVIDVRTADEYRQGHLARSQNIPLDQIGARIKSLQDKKKPLITVCRSGARSAMAQKMLKQKGIECYNGGAWTSFEKKIA